MASIPSPTCIEHEFNFTKNDFRLVQRLIYSHAGISLSDSKQNLVYNRLSRRLRAQGLATFAEYLQLLESDQDERQLFINALTTNLTSFFREEHHFSMLGEHIKQLGTDRVLELWSCAASTGEEPYSMAMTMADLFGTYRPPVRILATDIDTQALDTAKMGVYAMDKVENLTARQRQIYFKKGMGSNAGLVKVRRELQEMVTFRQLNLLNPHWGLKGPFDAIFCRNVMIYFDKPTQKKLLERFVPLMAPDCLLFAGHSENFLLVSNAFKLCGRTVYQLKKAGH